MCRGSDSNDFSLVFNTDNKTNSQAAQKGRTNNFLFINFTVTTWHVQYTSNFSELRAMFKDRRATWGKGNLRIWLHSVTYQLGDRQPLWASFTSKVNWVQNNGYFKERTFKETCDLIAFKLQNPIKNKLLLITSIVLDIGVWPTISLFKSEKLKRHFAPFSLSTFSVYSEIHVLLFSTKQHENNKSCEVSLYHSSHSQSLFDTFQGTLQYALKAIKTIIWEKRPLWSLYCAIL